MAKKIFFQKNKVQFSGTLFPVNFFNISTLEKGGGARPSAPRRGAPSRKNLFFAYKKSVWQKEPKPPNFFFFFKVQKLGMFKTFFDVFFQISSRTWGIDFRVFLQQKHEKIPQILYNVGAF